MIFIDSHAHVNDPAFDADRPAVIQNAFSAGLSHIIEIGCEVDEWQPALDLCAQYPAKIFCALGMHPIMAKNFNAEHLPQLKTFLQNPLVRAVGEIGLDYPYEDSTPKQKQREVFEAMLALAAEIKKPLVLHCRKAAAENDYGAYDDLFAMLKNASFSGGIMHCFSGRYDDAKKALDTGLLIGVTGIVGYKKNNDLRDTFKKIGLNYLTLETDCPYLPPQTKRGKRNAPAYIPMIAQDLAAALGRPLSEVAEITTQNTAKIFKL